MRKLILKMEVTVDGFVGEAGGDPAWPVAYYDDELAATRPTCCPAPASTPWAARRVRT